MVWTHQKRANTGAGRKESFSKLIYQPDVDDKITWSCAGLMKERSGTEMINSNEWSAMKSIAEGHAWEFKRVAAIFPSKSDMIFLLFF